MKEIAPVRILWLSDIHFKSEYTKKGSAKEEISLYLDKFFTKIESIEKVSRYRIKTIIISGDLARSGNRQEYSALYKMLIEPLKRKLNSNVALLTVPGNHDLDWKSAKNAFKKIVHHYASEEVNKRKKIKPAPAERKTLKDFNNLKYALGRKNKNSLFSRERKQHFFDLFKGYSAFLNKHNFNNGLNISGGDSNHHLFGHIVDETNKIIYTLLNTSWFCIHDFVKYKLRKIKSETERKNFIKFLTGNEIINEIDLLELAGGSYDLGGQFLGTQFLDQQNPLEVLNDVKYHTYAKVTVLHHPFHWLNYNELYTLSGENTFLHQIAEASDLILTGHEHLPFQIPANRIYEHPWHLQGGLFLMDNIDSTIIKNNDESTPDSAKQNLFPHNRFSVLDIYPDRAEETRYYYNSTKNDNPDWEQKPTSQAVKKMMFGRPYKPPVTVTKQYIRKFRDLDQHYLTRYFKDHQGIDLKYLDRHDDPVQSVFYFSDEENDKSRWIVVKPCNTGYYQKQLTATLREGHHFLDNHFEEIIKDNRIEKVSVLYFCLDLIIDERLYSSEIAEDEKRDTHEEQAKVLFGKIVKEADYYFDLLQYRWMDRDLNFLREHGSKLSFINVILPYWRLEQNLDTSNQLAVNQ